MQHLVMPFEEAKEYKEKGGSQETEYVWVHFAKHAVSVLVHRSAIHEYHYFIADFYAAPIIKTEI